MSNVVIDDINDIQDAYNSTKEYNKPHKTAIETTITNQLNKLFEFNLVDKLTQYRYFRDDNKEIANLLKKNQISQQILTVVENHLSSLVNDVKTRLLLDRSKIEGIVLKKSYDKKRNEKLDKTEQKLECSVLKRLNKMPEDVVRLIGEFAFTPKIRCILYRHLLPTLTLRLNKIKITKLKRISKGICEFLEKINRKISNNRSIVKSFPSDTDIAVKLNKVISCKLIIRESLTKSKKIEEIETFVNSAEIIVQCVERLGYPITTRNLYTNLLNMFCFVDTATNVKFNKRTRAVY